MYDLLDLALAAHGGLLRWWEINAIDVGLSIGGTLWQVKGLREGLRGVSLHMEAHRPSVRIAPFIATGETGHFTPEQVWIESAAGAILEELHRATLSPATP